MPAFNEEEKVQYARHFSLPDFGEEGQERLRAGRVLVVGAGGLGCPTLCYLAAAGVGQIGIVDPDQVSRSNLQRQVLYGIDDLGKKKAEIAKARLKGMNPHIKVESYPIALTPDNVFELIESYDLILDGTDNFATRYLINDACVLQNKVNIYASIFRFDGQVAVFNQSKSDGQRGPNYRDLFPTPPPPDSIPDCATGGVLGVLPGIVGTLQATEAIKLLAGIGESLSGYLLLIDALSMRFRRIRIPINPSVTIQDLTWYDQYCQLPTAPASQQIVRWEEVKNMSPAPTLIDVRTLAEHRAKALGDYCIPLAELKERIQDLPTEGPILFYCQTGKRSLSALSIALQYFPSTRLYHLEGGIESVTKS
ncbi:MAG: HesA/MoeB/ThiF family protein [Bacteroidota bacterium]